MSRGFVKEDDQEETPIIPPRAALPAGVTNYVTQKGLKQLKDELQELDSKILNLAETDERERRRALAVLNGTRNLLVTRLQSARTPEKIKDRAEIRFGATVSYSIGQMPKVITIQIVGVDEANVAQKKIAFTAPISKALMGKKVGDKVSFSLGNEMRTLEIKEINYNDKE